LNRHNSRGALHSFLAPPDAPTRWWNAANDHTSKTLISFRFGFRFSDFGIHIFVLIPFAKTMVHVAQIGPYECRM